MIQPNVTVSFAGGLILGALLILGLAAQEPEAKPDPTQQELVKALIASQERQAAAWEKLAAQGWPAPQNNTFTGNVPSSLDVHLSGSVEIGQDLGWWKILNQ